MSDVMGQVGNVEERSVRWIEEKSRLFSWILRELTSRRNLDGNSDC